MGIFRKGTGVARKNQADTQSQHTSFRVTVYRLDLKRKFIISQHLHISLNEILQLDPSDSRYTVVTDFFNKKHVLQALLKTIEEEVKAGISSGLGHSQSAEPSLYGTTKKFPPQSLFNNKGIFKQIDITPMVSAVSVKTELDGLNSCTLSVIDSAFSDFGPENISDATVMMPSLNSSESSIGSSDIGGLKKSLRGFILKEFDFVRVDGYSRIDEPVSGRMNGLAKVGIDTKYATTPMFTGFVSDITRSAVVGSVPSVSVTCHGVSRLFTQSVAVFNKSIAQNLTDLDDSGESLAALNVNINALGSQFQGKTSVGVFLEIMDTYLHPTHAGPRSELGVADLSTKHLDSMLVNSKGRILVPILPAVIMLHILKYMGMEPIYMMDDFLESHAEFMVPPKGSSPHPHMGPRDPKLYDLSLEPYLEMTRDVYELYNSAYLSPAEVLSTIKTQSFYEIFEDRSGTIHFRMPRYNSSLIKRHCDVKDTSAVTLKKTDSGVYNMSLAYSSVNFHGKMDGISPEHYIDKLSILRVGMRMPVTVENPNAKTTTFAALLSKFMRDYSAGRTSRTASITRLIDLAINPGDMVSFRCGAIGKIGDVYSTDGESTLFVGYVTSVAENITVGGANAQTLELSFVRSVDNGGDGPMDADWSSGNRFVDINTAVNALRKPPGDKSQYGDDQGNVRSGAIKAQEKVFMFSPFVSKNIEDYLVNVSDGDVGQYMTRFRYVADPIDLVISANLAVKHSRYSSSVDSGGPRRGFTLEQKRAAVNSARIAVEKRAVVLAEMVMFGKILSKLSEITKIKRVGLVDFLLSPTLFAVRYTANRVTESNDASRTLPELGLRFREAVFSAVSSVKNSQGLITHIPTIGSEELSSAPPGSPLAVALPCNTVVLQIPGIYSKGAEGAGQRTIYVSSKKLNGFGEGMILTRASTALTTIPSKDKETFISDYNRLFRATSTPPDGFSADDIKNAHLILSYVLGTYLDWETSTLAIENIQKDVEMQRLINLVAVVESEMASAQSSSDARDADLKRRSMSGDEYNDGAISIPQQAAEVSLGNIDANIQSSTIKVNSVPEHLLPRFGE